MSARAARLPAAPVPAVRSSFVAPLAAAARSFGPSWRALAAHPFVTPEWFALTARLLPVGDPLVVGVREGDRLAAALPLAMRDGELSALATDHTPRFDLVGDPAALPSLWRELRGLPAWRVLRLREVMGESPLVTMLPQLAAADGFTVTIRKGPPSPAFRLPGFAERLDAKFRANLRRRRKKLGDTLTFERITEPSPSALEEGFRLEAAGWKGAAGTAIACDPRLLRYYQALAHAFAHTGQLSLTFLKVEGKPIAFHFALEQAGTYFLLKPGFDPDYAKLGPGHLLVFEAASDAERRGLEEFDFLGWDMEWKRPWTEQVRCHVSVAIHRPTLGNRVAFMAQELLSRGPSKLERLLGKWSA